MTLMRRRRGYSPDQQLDTIHYNMRAEYRLFMSRTTIQTTTELIQRAEKLEENRRQAETEGLWQKKTKSQGPASGELQELAEEILLLLR